MNSSPSFPFSLFLSNLFSFPPFTPLSLPYLARYLSLFIYLLFSHQDIRNKRENLPATTTKKKRFNPKYYTPFFKFQTLHFKRFNYLLSFFSFVPAPIPLFPSLTSRYKFFPVLTVLLFSSNLLFPISPFTFPFPNLPYIKLTIPSLSLFSLFLTYFPSSFCPFLFPIPLHYKLFPVISFFSFPL